MQKNRVLSIVIISVLVLSSLTLMFPVTTASPEEEYGPKVQHLRFPVIKSPDAQLLAMQRRDIDILTDLIRPTDIETLSAAGRTITAAPADHFCYVTFNFRRFYFQSDNVTNPQDGGMPGLALRHAIAHCIPKEVLIGTLFKYIVTKITAPVPPAQGEWYSGTTVDPHPFDPALSVDILVAAGYYYFPGGTWHMPDGTEIPELDFLSPTREAAPTSFQIVADTVKYMKILKFANDTACPLPVKHSPTEFTAMLKIIRFPPYNWDMYFLCWGGLGRYADFLFAFFHSSQDVPGGYNNQGIHNDALDAEVWTVWTSLDHVEKVEAACTAQEILMGTPEHTYTTDTNGLIVYIPIYSRTYYNAHDDNLGGIINMPLDGSNNAWTTNMMYWKANNRKSDMVYIDPGPDEVWCTGDDVPGDMVVWCEGEEIEVPTNPAWVSGAYTWDVLGRIYDGIISVNAYSVADRAWMLDVNRDPDYPDTPGWYIEPGWTVPDGPAAGETGMKITYYLKDDLPVWHDGHQMDAFDIAFTMEYLAANAIPRPWPAHKYVHHTEVTDPTTPVSGYTNPARTLKVYVTTESQWIPYDLAGWSVYLPEHIWGSTHDRGGRATANNAWVNRANGWNAYLANNNAAGGNAGTKPATEADSGVESGLCAEGVPGTADFALRVKIDSKTTDRYKSGCVIGTTPEIHEYNPTEFSRWSNPGGMNVAPYDPNAETAYPWLTELVGQGEYIWKHYDPSAMVADLIAFDLRTQGYMAGPPEKLGTNPGVSPESHFWKTTDELHGTLVQYLYECGDVDKTGVIDLDDYIAEALGYGCMRANFIAPGIPPVDDPCYNSQVDINKDGIIDMREVELTSKYYGTKREYP